MLPFSLERQSRCWPEHPTAVYRPHRSCFRFSSADVHEFEALLRPYQHKSLLEHTRVQVRSLAPQSQATILRLYRLLASVLMCIALPEYQLFGLKACVPHRDLSLAAKLDHDMLPSIAISV